MAQRARRHSQSGTALVLSLITVMIIASLGAGLVQLHSAIDKRQEFAIDRRRALYLAEAGLAEASFALSQGRTGVIASEAVPARFGRGVYWVEADALPGDRTALRCTARLGSAEFVLRTMVLPNVNPITSLGFFGTDAVTIGWATIVDGYHSADGEYANQVDAALPVTSTGELGLIGSDADIVLMETPPTQAEILGVTTLGLNSGSLTATSNTSAGAWAALAGGTPPGPGTGAPATGGGTLPSVGTGTPTGDTLPTHPTYIYGQLRPGAQSVVRSGGLSIIDGEIDPYDAPPALPEVSLPDPSEYLMGSVVIAADQTDIGANVETWVEEDVIVNNGATLEIVGPALLRCRTLQLEDGASLVLDDEQGAIHIYAEEGLNFHPGTKLRSVAKEEASRGTFILVPGSVEASDRITLRSTGKFHGALYAPDDILRIPRGLHWLGSAVARVIFAAPGSHLTYDRRISLGGDGLPALPQQLSWQVVPMGKEVARLLPMEPVLALTLAGITPVPSATAAIETDVTLSYIDISGSPATYNGTLAGFPQASAQRVLGARWVDPRDGAPQEWTTPVGAESTEAIAEDRRRLRLLKKVIKDNNPTQDVAALEVQETLLEVSRIMDGLDVSGEPIEVRRAVQRVDPDAVSMLPDPAGAAERSVEVAESALDKALAIRTTAVALPVLTTNPGASNPLIQDLQNAVAAAQQAVVLARARDIVAQDAADPAQENAAQEVIALTEEALEQRQIAEALLGQLLALPAF